MAEATVLKMSRDATGTDYWGIDGHNDGHRHKAKVGQLYRLDDGSIVVAAKRKALKIERFGASDEVVWKMWSLPDYVPERQRDMTRNYRSDWFDDDGDVYGDPDEVYLFWTGGTALDPKTFNPADWGGSVAPTTEDDPRILAVLEPGVIAVQLRHVPKDVKRSAAFFNLRDLTTTSSANRVIGSHTGPDSSTGVDGMYYAAMNLADLPAATRPTPQVEIPLAPQYKHGNSGRTYAFEAGTNPFTRELGWKPLDLAGDGKLGPAFDPVAPVMAVHDLMEHFPGDEYSPHNEYMAQGAMLWLRFEGGFFGSTNVADAVVKPAFGMLFHHINNGKLNTSSLPDTAMSLEDKSRVLNHGMPNATYFALAELIVKAKSFIDSQYTYNDQKDRLHRSLVNGIPWIHHGYQRAAKRYEGLNKNRLVSLYKGTVEQISKVVPGAKLKMTLNYESYTSKVEIEATIKV